MKFKSSDGLEFDTVEEALYWNKNKKKLSDKALKKRKERIDKGLKRKEYNTILPKRYIQYQRRANAKQLPFSLSVDEFNQLIILPCTYCGISRGTMTIDRIDSSLGYEIDNVAPCCQQCNTMKFTYSVDDFIDQVKRIYEHTKDMNIY